MNTGAASRPSSWEKKNPAGCATAGGAREGIPAQADEEARGEQHQKGGDATQASERAERRGGEVASGTHKRAAAARKTTCTSETLLYSHSTGATPPLEPRARVRMADDCALVIEHCPTPDPLPLRCHSTRPRPVRWKRTCATIGCIVPSNRLQGAASSVRSGRRRSSPQHRLRQDSRVHLQRRWLAQKNDLHGPPASTDIR